MAQSSSRVSCVSDQRKWDQRFVEMAYLVGGWSKDPSTKTGAVIVDTHKRVVSVGYHGFPAPVADDERLQSRELKYEIIVHAEVNALIFAQRAVVGCTLYTHPFMSCSRCAAIIIQAGIRRHVAPRNDAPRWAQSFERARQLFREANVEVVWL
jgi:dCMP deaminase